MRLFSASATGERVNATTTSGATFATLDASGATIRVVSHGPETAYFSVGSVQRAATIPVPGVGVRTCTTVLAGSDITLGIESASGEGPLHFAALTASGTATLDVFISNGI